MVSQNGQVGQGFQGDDPDGQGNEDGLLVLVWSDLLNSVLVCSGLGLRDSLHYFVLGYLGFHGSFDDSHGICLYICEKCELSRLYTHTHTHAVSGK